MRRAVLLVAVLVASPALAGCLESGPAPGSGGDAGEGDHVFEADGLVLRLDRDREAIEPGERVHVNASVTNEGEAAVAYREGCRHEWSVAVLDEGGDEVNWSRPMATCEGFSWERLDPGESLPFPHEEGAKPFPWNGTIWDGEDWVDADPGRYRMAVTFEYEPDGNEDSEGLEELPGSVNVTVEERS